VISVPNLWAHYPHPACFVGDVDRFKRELQKQGVDAVESTPTGGIRVFATSVVPKDEVWIIQGPRRDVFKLGAA